MKSVHIVFVILTSTNLSPVLASTSGQLFIDDDYSEYRCKISTDIPTSAAFTISQYYRKFQYVKLRKENLDICGKPKSLEIRTKIVQLTDIQEDAFENMKQVETLRIQADVSSLSVNLFLPLTKLKDLSLTLPKVSQLDPRIFRISEELEYLYLRTSVTNIKPEMFDKLKLIRLTIIVSPLAVIETGALVNMTKLKILRLSNNKLADFDGTKLLGSSTSLTDLFLDYNFLSYLSRSTTDSLVNLEILDLKRNRISKLERNLFYYSSRLHTVNLAHNRIGYLTPDTFSKETMRGMKFFDISFNRIYQLSPWTAFMFWRVESISIVGNPWKCNCLDQTRILLAEMNVTEMCSTAFYKGKLPVCVVPKSSDTFCTYTIEFDDYYHSVYEDGLGEEPLDCELSSFGITTLE